MEGKHIPNNMVIMWHRGTKSFIQGLQFPKGSHGRSDQIFWKEANERGQLPEEAYKLAFQVMMGLAQDNPQDKFQYTRYDNEFLVEENENNRPFRLGEGKTIHIFGYEYTYGEENNPKGTIRFGVEGKEGG